MHQPKTRLISPVITLLTGILFTAVPDILRMICLAVGGGMCAAGAVLFLVYFLSGKTYGMLPIRGGAFLAGGILLCIVPTLLKFLIPVFFGIWILLGAVEGILRSIQLQGKGRWIAMLLCALGVVAGILCITQPAEMTDATVRMIGVCLIVYSVLRLVSGFLALKLAQPPAADAVIETSLTEE